MKGKIIKKPYTVSVIIAFIVTLLWSSSFIIVKRFITEIPALPFAGLRYTGAFLILLSLTLGRNGLHRLKGISKPDWFRLILLGIVFYTFTQGAQFLALRYLPAVTVSIFYSFTPFLVTLFGRFLLKERLSPLQFAGIPFFIAGVVLYFLPLHSVSASPAGLVCAAAGLFANSAAALLGRRINGKGNIDPLTITTVSMGIGGVLLLATGVAVQGLPGLTFVQGAAIIWLGAVNTALAFTLWNFTLKTLSATQSSIINNTMLFQVMILSFIFLNEELSPRKIIAVLIAVPGVVLITRRKSDRNISR